VAAEVAILLSAAKAANELLKEAKPLVESISSNWRGRAANENAKRELQQKITDLGLRLREVGGLAERGDEYTRLHEEILELQWDCERALTFLTGSFPAASDSGNHAYHNAWDVLDTIFDSVAKRIDPVRRVREDTDSWYDEADSIRLRQHLMRWSDAYQQAVASVRAKAASNTRHELEEMVSELRDVEGLLRDTLYGKIFASLRLLGT
jgi:hypothetical protein